MCYESPFNYNCCICQHQVVHIKHYLGKICTGKHSLIVLLRYINYIKLHKYLDQQSFLNILNQGKTKYLPLVVLTTVILQNMSKVCGVLKYLINYSTHSIRWRDINMTKIWIYMAVVAKVKILLTNKILFSNAQLWNIPEFGVYQRRYIVKVQWSTV